MTDIMAYMEFWRVKAEHWCLPPPSKLERLWKAQRRRADCERRRVLLKYLEWLYAIKRCRPYQKARSNIMILKHPAGAVENTYPKGDESMTLKELSQLYHLNREIEMDKRRLQRLEADVRYREAGFPEQAAEAADLRGIIEAKHQQCLYERSRLERYISGIEDSLLRQIFTYRFINGLSWSQVAAHIGGGNTEGGVKMLCLRYLRRK